MSLGPVNSSANRLSQLRATEIQRTESPTAAPASTTRPAAEVERASVDPSIQSGVRETQRGVEDAIRGRLEQSVEGAPGGAGTPRRGLGGSNTLDSEALEFVGKRAANGRRTAATMSRSSTVA
jgi:hypothetical protein